MTVAHNVTLDEARQIAAKNAIHTHVAWTSGAAMLPVPILDVAAVIAIQVKLVRDLARIYDVEFKANLAKTAVSALVGGLLPTTITGGATSLVKAIPFVGGVLGAVTAPAIFSASTFAVGRVFMMHFEAGGTLLNFNADEMKGHFKSAYTEASDAADTAAETVKETVKETVEAAATPRGKTGGAKAAPAT